MTGRAAARAWGRARGRPSRKDRCTRMSMMPINRGTSAGGTRPVKMKCSASPSDRAVAHQKEFEVGPILHQAGGDAEQVIVPFEFEQAGDLANHQVVRANFQPR